MDTTHEGSTPEPYMLAKEVAEILRCSVSTVHRFTRTDALPYRQMGREKRFVREEIRAWLDSKRIVNRPVAPQDGGVALPSTAPAKRRGPQPVIGSGLIKPGTVPLSKFARERMGLNQKGGAR